MTSLAARATGRELLDEGVSEVETARSLADQHNSFAYAAREAGASELNVNVQSPR